MKFAVIEYTSKSGGIWRHTDEKPNYLADPAREIDSTSFGCYVSALKGEHIPLTYLLKAKSIARRLYRKLAGHWPQNYSLNYLKQFDVLMIVHEIGNGPSITRLTQRIKSELPHTTRLGVATQPFGILKDHWEQDQAWLANFKEFMDVCDAFIATAASTKTTLETMTVTPVHYLPQPYPAKYATGFHLKRADKNPIIFVAGVTSRDNILKGHDVAKQLQKKYPDYVIHVTDIPGHTLDISKLADTRYEKVGFQPWREHLEYLNKVTLVINTDYTQTRGRVQVDCAAAGTPSIGADSDGQQDLFPQLSANRATPVQELVEQGERLLMDTNFYQEVVSHALQNIERYDYAHAARHVQDLVSKLAK